MRMTESRKDVIQSDDEADTVESSQMRMTEYGEDVVQSVDEADKDLSQNSPTSLQSISSSKTEFEGRRSTHIPSIEAQPILSEEDNLLQAAFTILYTVPRAIEDFVDREYKGGFVQSIRDHKDQLKATLSSEEWELLSQIIVHHRLYHLYDKIIQDTILDKDVLDLLISKCILRIEDRAEIEHHPKPSDRNKCILDLLIQRPEDSYSVLLEVLKESPTCSKDLIECMEGQQLPIMKFFHSPKLNHVVQGTIQNVIDSLISKGVLEPDDHADIASSGVSAEMNRKLIAKIRSKQDYMLFLEALKEDPVSANAELASVLESTDVNQDELNQTANIPQLTNRPGFQSLVTLVSMVKAVQISDTEPESHDSRLAADLYRLQSWYKKIIKMSSMDLDKYQQFVQTVNEVLGRISGQNDPVVKETTLSAVMQKQVKKMLHGFKEKEKNSELKEKLNKMETELGEKIPKNNRGKLIIRYQQKLLQYLLELDKPQQVILASTKDTVVPKEDCGSGNTPLVLTCYDGYTDMVEWVLHNGVYVDQCRDNGVTGLRMASQEGHTDIVKLLENIRKRKKNIYESLVKKVSPHVADYVNKKSVDYVFDVEAGCSPLHLACFMGKIDVVRCLLDHNADINMTKEDGTTPLFYACEVGHEDIVCLLLDKGADTQICRLDGKSPLTIATDNGHTSIDRLDSDTECLLSLQDRLDSDTYCLLSLHDRLDSDTECLLSLQDRLDSDTECLLSLQDRLASDT
ncbi:ANK [Mytilus edulis]|uniref:ANK n=1 Tax=Mytilus edulis TaxID=6550 RepID=A0A8S3RJT1_MYTED|nr:ANK [Mytilus edulis]